MIVTRYPMIGSVYCLNPAVIAHDLEQIGVPAEFRGLANSITCPTGQEPGSAWFLVKRSVGAALAKNSYHDLKWVHEDSNGKPTTTTFKNYVLCRAVLIGLDGDGKAPYLLEFRDKRQVLKFSTIDREYHIRRTTRQGDTGSTDLYYTDSRNAGSDWTWQTMFDDVWGDLPSAIRGTAPTLAYTPASEPEGFRFHGSAWDAVGEILEATHSILCWNPITDVFTVQRIGDEQSGLAAAQSALNAGTKRLTTATPLTDMNLATAPHTIRFFFPKRLESDNQLVETVAGGPLVDPYHTIDKTTSLTGAQAGTVLPYRTRFIAEVDADGNTINNASALDTLAGELRDKIVNRIDVAGERGRDHFGGIVTTVLPGSEIAKVVWRDYGDADGLRTETWRGPDLSQVKMPPMEIAKPFEGEFLLFNDSGSDIGPGGSGTFEVWAGTPGSEADTGQTFTAYVKSSIAFKNGKFGSGSVLNGQNYAVPWQT